MKILAALALLLGIAASPLTPAAAQGKGAAKDTPLVWTGSDAGTPKPVTREKGVSVDRGRRVFAAQCAGCHGAKGRGDGPRSAEFAADQYIPDLSTPGFVEGRDAEILASIRFGLRRLDEPLIVMPQFRYILAEDEMRSVLEYVKTLPDAKARERLPRR